MNRLITIVSLLLLSLQSYAGANAGSDGGFVLYEKKSRFVAAAESLSYKILHLDGENFKTIFDTFASPTNTVTLINPVELSKIIKTFRFNLGQPIQYKPNPSGEIDIVDMGYGVTEFGEKYIEGYDYLLLQPESNSQQWIEKKLLHEALHHFGYREDQARKASRIIINAIQTSAMLEEKYDKNYSLDSYSTFTISEGSSLKIVNNNTFSDILYGWVQENRRYDAIIYIPMENKKTIMINFRHPLISEEAISVLDESFLRTGSPGAVSHCKVNSGRISKDGYADFLKCYKKKGQDKVLNEQLIFTIPALVRENNKNWISTVMVKMVPTYYENKLGFKSMILPQGSNSHHPQYYMYSK